MSVCFVQKTVDQSLASNTFGIVEWDTVIFDPLGMFDPGAPTLISVPAGYDFAEVTYNISWDTNTAFDRYSALLKDGAGTPGSAMNTLRASNGERTRMAGKTILPLLGAACDLSVQAWQNTGASRLLTGGNTPIFHVKLLNSP